MAYTVQQLITNSYYLSQVVARELQSVSGSQISDGLDLMNDLLGVQSGQVRLISYFKEYNSTLVAGQEKYTIPGLIYAETFTFNIGPVRYQTYNLSRDQYWGSSQVDNINALPFNFNFERTLGGSILSVYFKPQDNYPFRVWGKFGLNAVILTDDLEAVYDRYFIVYLRYALAEYICNFYNMPMPEEARIKLQELTRVVTDISPPDLKMKKLSSFSTGSPFNWGDVNLGKGFRPI